MYVAVLVIVVLAVLPAFLANALVSVTDVQSKVVNLPVFAVVLPIAGGLDKSKVPPNIRVPVEVTVPVKVRPLTVPVPATEVTVPCGFAAVVIPVTRP